MDMVKTKDLREFFNKSIKSIESAWLSEIDIQYDVEVIYWQNRIIGVSKIKRNNSMIKKILYVDNEFYAVTDSDLNTKMSKVEARGSLALDLNKTQNMSCLVAINTQNVFIEKFKVIHIKNETFKSNEVSVDYLNVITELINYYDKNKKAYM